MKRSRHCLRAAVLLAGLTLASSAAAADIPPATELPDLAPIRAQIYAGEFTAAAAELQALSTTVQHADLYNLLGYSLRKLGRHDEAGRWYREALHFDPGHRPALAYQGELFIAIGDIEAAHRNLRYLNLLCTGPSCIERDELHAALTLAGHPPPQDKP
ncbi:tetratricopeptide repeat protein [Thauera butanivorans]|uniref:tetratricopeptide repeat protein n=1 Tax=Thauera butanivorans TaxID=86174 RepID=UPI003AB576C7